MKLYSVRSLRYQRYPAVISVHEGTLGPKSVSIKHPTGKNVYTLPRESFMRRFYGTAFEAKRFLSADLRVRLKQLEKEAEQIRVNLEAVAKFEE